MLIPPDGRLSTQSGPTVSRWRSFEDDYCGAHITTRFGRSPSACQGRMPLRQEA